MTQTADKPGFNPWPYAIVGFFVLAVLAAVSWVGFCIGQGTDLVAADYYEQEMEYQLQLDRVGRGQGLRERAGVHYDSDTASIRIQLPREHAVLRPRGQIHFYRPSKAALDRTLRLNVAADGTQQIDASGLAPGLWDVRVRWEANGQEFFLNKELHLIGTRS